MRLFQQVLLSVWGSRPLGWPDFVELGLLTALTVLDFGFGFAFGLIELVFVVQCLPAGAIVIVIVIAIVEVGMMVLVEAVEAGRLLFLGPALAAEFAVVHSGVPEVERTTEAGAFLTQVKGEGVSLGTRKQFVLEKAVVRVQGKAVQLRKGNKGGRVRRFGYIVAMEHLLVVSLEGMVECLNLGQVKV